MSYQAFLEAMDNKLSIGEKTKMLAYFRAFDAQQKSYLTYSDYLLGALTELIPTLEQQRLLSLLRSGGNGSKHFSRR